MVFVSNSYLWYNESYIDFKLCTLFWNTLYITDRFIQCFAMRIKYNIAGKKNAFRTQQTHIVYFVPTKLNIVDKDIKLILNNNGPSTDPWTTPNGTGRMGEQLNQIYGGLTILVIWRKAASMPMQIILQLFKLKIIINYYQIIIKLNYSC